MLRPLEAWVNQASTSHGNAASTPLARGDEAAYLSQLMGQGGDLRIPQSELVENE